MKIMPVISILLITAVSGFSSDNLLCFGINLQAGLHAGIEHRFAKRFSGKCDLGISVIGLITADALAVFHLTPPDRKWELNVCGGMPDAGVPFTFKEGMISLGAALMGRRYFRTRLSTDLRIGAGFPLFFKKGSDVVRDTNWPLNLWPDLMLGFNIAL